VFKSTFNPKGPQSPLRLSHTPMMVASAIYFVLGLATLGDLDHALLMGVGYIILSACYYQGYRR
jgi:hypothetical protein